MHGLLFIDESESLANLAALTEKLGHNYSYIQTKKKGL